MWDLGPKSEVIIGGRLRVLPRVVCPWVKVDAPLLEDGPPVSVGNGRCDGVVTSE